MAKMSSRLISGILQCPRVALASPGFRRGVLRSGVLIVWLILNSIALAMPAPGDEGPTDPAVTDSTGSANYRIPIEVPPGPGGLAPNVTLSYSSRQGDGPYGVGWDLGLSSITCSTRFGIPSYGYGTCDKFELDGQLLTRDPATNLYHSFVETFERIEYSTASKSWTVTSTKGVIRRYGQVYPGEDDARIMSGSEIATWLLTEVEDPFGNTVFYSYDKSIDIGTRYPKQISYGPGATRTSGKRSIQFIFGEVRPDPIHDYHGGIERKITRRLTEIQVASFGEITRRYAFGYSLDGVTYTTGRSRLSWVQEFGDDCEGDISSCNNGLPQQEFRYNDPNDDLASCSTRFCKRPANEDYQAPFNSILWFSIASRFADLNGDGLPDLIEGGRTPSGNDDPLRIRLNTGAGFVARTEWTAAEEAAWTAANTAWRDAIMNLPIERPRMNFNQAVVPYQYHPYTDPCFNGPCPMSGIYSASSTTVTEAFGTDPIPSEDRPWVRGTMNAAYSPQGSTTTGSVEAIPRLFFHDVDGDGRADIVVSVRLSGVDKVVNNQGIPLPNPNRVDGQTVSRVYRNTGSNWVEDTNLGRGLPVFGEVLIESTYAVESQNPVNSVRYADEWENGDQNDTCGMRGMRGWIEYTSQGNSFAEDLCINLVDLAPRFVDLNGDGFSDLMVLEAADPDLLHRGWATFLAFGVDDTFNPSKSTAWIQVPDADTAIGESRWVRAPQFDLPMVDYGYPTFAGLEPLPFAHAQPHTGAWLGGPEFKTSTCPNPLIAGTGKWSACMPLTHNYDTGLRFVDLNRDGLTDIAWSATFAQGLGSATPLLTEGVLLNTGTGWCLSAAVGDLAAFVETIQSICPHAANYLPPPPDTQASPPESWGTVADNLEPPRSSSGQFHDMNGDGWLDFVFYTPFDLSFAHGRHVWLYDPAGATGPNASVWKRDSRYDPDVVTPASFGAGDRFVQIQALDLNGDGATDFTGANYYYFPNTYINARISNTEFPDLLKRVDNGRGGSIEFTYESAIKQRDEDNSTLGLEQVATAHAEEVGEEVGITLADTVRWTSQPVVSSTTLAGPNFVSNPSSYRYAHPRYCLKSRSDLGFRVVERTRSGGEVVTTSFYQFHGRAGKTSKSLVSDEGVDVYEYREYWETQESLVRLPSEPAPPRDPVPALVPGGINDSEQFVGRLAQTHSLNLYAGGGVGALSVKTLNYDDAFGYNFVSRIVAERPTATPVTHRLPYADISNNIFGLVATEKQFDNLGATISSTDFLSHTATAYTNGRPSTVTSYVKPRGDPGAGTEQIRSVVYDTYGNPASVTAHGETAADDRVTYFCYDGDTACDPGFGQDSYSVRIGVIDAKGGEIFFDPDPGTGAIVGTRSSYRDEPWTSLDLDPFGRPVASYVSHNGHTWLQTSYTEYSDVSYEPLVITRYDYPKAPASNTEAIWSSVVSDGFGGVWKEIRESPSGYVGTFTYHDLGTRTVRKSLPVDCDGDSLCASFDGSSAPIAMLMTADAIGRPIRDERPYGFSVFEYSTAVKNAGPGANGDSYDVVLEKNGAGHLTQRAYDGDRLVWVDECGNTALPADETLGACTKGGLPDLPTTYTTYEATGETSAVHDAKAEAPYTDANHYLAYTYDTLGRIVRIDDSAKTGLGYSTMMYDEFGNVESSVNARGQARTYDYDELNRLTQIVTPAGEGDYGIIYRNDRKPFWDGSDNYSRYRHYDRFGRLVREELKVDLPDEGMTSFHTTYAYDLLGRVITVREPENHGDGEGTLTPTRFHYEYDRAFLTRVCDVGEATDCDGSISQLMATFEYDDLGRREKAVLPGGERTLAYDALTQRLTKDEFLGGAGSSYSYTRNYDGFDGIGNILEISGSETATPALDMNESYSYDQRNRIDQWIKGATYDFEYDELGNLTRHAGEQQFYEDAERPQAITRREPGSTVTYSYDDDGNVTQILGGTANQYFEYDSADRLTCMSVGAVGCGPGGVSGRNVVEYDVSGRRVLEILAFPAGAYRVHVRDGYVIDSASGKTDLDIIVDGERFALKRFEGTRRGPGPAAAPTGWPTTLPPEVGLGVVVISGALLLVWFTRSREGVLIRRYPLRAATALGAAASLMLPSITMAGGGVPSPVGDPPEYFWEISDPLGTGMVLLDDSGDRIRHQTFTPFGRIHAEVGAELRTYYAGHRRDDESGLFYMQARWYDPGAGRFLSVDPLMRTAAVPQSANPYSYTENNPVNGVDPAGTDMWRINFTNADGNRVATGKWQSGNPAGSDLGQNVMNAVASNGGTAKVNGSTVQLAGTNPTSDISSKPAEDPKYQSGNAASADAQGGGGRNQTVWGESGTYAPGEGAFSGSDYLTAVLPRGPSLGYTEAGFGAGPFQGVADAAVDVFVGMMLHLGSLPIAVFGHGTGFFLHLPVLPFRFGQSASRNWHEAVRAGRLGALGAGVGRFESAGNTLVRQLPRQIRNDFFSGE